MTECKRITDFPCFVLTTDHAQMHIIKVYCILDQCTLSQYQRYDSNYISSTIKSKTIEGKKIKSITFLLTPLNYLVQ